MSKLWARGSQRLFVVCKYLSVLLARFVDFSQLIAFFDNASKTKGLDNTGQIISIYKDADEELVGLSMKRFDFIFFH